VCGGAEARLAVEYLRRAEDYAAEVDEEIAGETVLIHERLLNKIDSLRNPSQTIRCT
jgi:hypothetical protein